MMMVMSFVLHVITIKLVLTPPVLCTGSHLVCLVRSWKVPLDRALLAHLQKSEKTLGVQGYHQHHIGLLAHSELRSSRVHV